MNWRGRLTDTITLQSRTGSANGYADPTWGAQSTLPAKVKVSSKLFRNTQGELVQASHEMITETQLQPGDRVWVPGASTADPKAARTVYQSDGETLLGSTYRIYRTVLG